MHHGETSAQSPVACLAGIGPKRAADLDGAGLGTIGRLLLHLPLRYEDKQRLTSLREAPPGERRLFRLRIRSLGQGRGGRGGRLHRLEVRAEDQEGKGVLLRWFNQPFRAAALAGGDSCFAYGALSVESGENRGPIMENPELEPDADPDTPLAQGPHLGRIVPVYRRVGSAGSRIIRAAIYGLFDEAATTGYRPDPSPGESVLRDHGFPCLAELLRGVHLPPRGADPDLLNGGLSIWHRGLAFDELHRQQAELARRRRERLESRKAMPPGVIAEGLDDMPRVMETITGFRLTGGQRTAIEAVVQDMERPWPMRRLLQGEVGCGKTVVAYASLIRAAGGGRQAALMAPTEALAGQHHERLLALLTGKDVPGHLRRMAEGIILVTGGSTAEQRRRTERQMAGPGALIAIGTHALLSSAVVFRDLALAVVDEQQRFGVGQRDRLRSKGAHPDELVISATPIPRTLGLRLCGDMEMSRIRDLPHGGRNVDTVCLEPGQAARALDMLEQELDRGRQGFVVCPVVRGGRGRVQRSAENVFRRFATGRLARYRPGLLHGGMDLDEARTVMERFVSGRIGVLITTTVVEVGLDVPRATVMVVLEPERFGLSQLHQLRGRVGRGKWPGRFILLRSMDDTKGEARERLSILAASDDGFYIAEADLRLRGSGDLTGERQAGTAGWRMTASTLDTGLLNLARAAAFHADGPAVDQ